MSNDRYIRQTIIPGWDQSKLYGSSIAVIGSGPLAIATMMGLSMLGFGDINIYDNSVFKRYDPSEFLYFGEAPGTFKVDALTDIFKLTNPDIRNNPHNIKMGTIWKFLNRDELCLLDGPDGKSVYDLILDTTNDPHTEKLVIEYALSRGVPIINGSTKAFKGEVKVIADRDRVSGARWAELSPDYHCVPQDPIMSGLIGGLMVEEARKLVMPLKGEVIDNISINVNFLSKSMLGYTDDYTNLNPRYDNKTIDVIGAGSLGVHVVRGLVQRGVGTIRVYDKDTIEELNLNRQFDYTLEDTINQPKATSLKRIASKYSRKPNIVAINDFFEGTFTGKVPNAIFRCTDSFKTSEMLNRTALNYNIPLFYAATASDIGQAYAFIPGKTPCLEEVFNVSQAAKNLVAPAGCADEPIPSVCTVNMIMANAQLSLFDLWCAGQDSPVGYFDYNNKNKGRVCVIPTDYDCKHFQKR